MMGYESTMPFLSRQLDFQETWQTLRESMQKILGLHTVKRDLWNNLFSDVFAICVGNPDPLADRLYDETKTFLEEHVAILLKSVRGDATSEPDIALLQRYHHAWIEYSQGVEYLDVLFSNLNLIIKEQQFSGVKKKYGSGVRAADELLFKLEVGHLALRIWELVLVRPLASELTVGVLRAIDAARENSLQGLHEGALREVIHSLIAIRVWCADRHHTRALNLYTELVEAPYLAASQQQHARTEANLLSKNGLSLYMQEMILRWAREKELVERLLHSSSFERARETFEKSAVADMNDVKFKERIHAVGESLLHEQEHGDVHHAYLLLRLIDPDEEVMRPLVEAAKKHAVIEVRAALQAEHLSENASQHLVICVLAVRDRLVCLYSDLFCNNQAFLAAVDIACNIVVNGYSTVQLGREYRATEMLARYCDQVLRRSDEDSDAKLTDAIKTFKFLDEKDIFEKYYARGLSNRLIHKLSANMELEEKVINRLSDACGYDYTKNLNRMFTDSWVSEDLNVKFAEHLRATNVELSVGVTIQVLHAGAWPLATGESTTFLSGALTQFEQFYDARFSGRKLTWLHELCIGEVRTLYTKCPYTVSLTAPQCALLLTWDTGELTPLSVSNLCVQHQLSKDTFLRYARPLVDMGLLHLHGDLYDETESSTLELNVDFKSKRTKIRIKCLEVKATPKKPPLNVDRDRIMYLEAAIIRIMKSRKTLQHNELVAEVCTQARLMYAPSVTMIKKCIEVLIDKAYLERAPAQPDTYSYLA